MTPGTCGFPRAAALPLDETLVFANQQLQVGQLLFREFHENLLALGILEALTVFPEKAMRAAFAADPDHERLLVIDAFCQALGAFREEPVRGALEEQKRGPRFQERIGGQQLGISRFERAEMLLLFPGQLLKDAAAPRVLGDAGGARVELEPAALCGN